MNEDNAQNSPPSNRRGNVWAVIIILIILVAIVLFASMRKDNSADQTGQNQNNNALTPDQNVPNTNTDNTQTPNPNAVTGDTGAGIDTGTGVTGTAGAGTSTPPVTGSGTSGTGTTPAATPKNFTVTATNYSFSTNQIKVKQGDKVKITLNNTEGMHDLVIDAFNAKTPILQGGKSATIEFTADQKGSFEFYCSVGNHRQMGMKGTFIVE